MDFTKQDLESAAIALQQGNISVVDYIDLIQSTGRELYSLKKRASGESHFFKDTPEGKPYWLSVEEYMKRTLGIPPQYLGKSIITGIGGEMQGSMNFHEMWNQPTAFTHVRPRQTGQSSWLAQQQEEYLRRHYYKLPEDLRQYPMTPQECLTQQMSHTQSRINTLWLVIKQAIFKKQPEFHLNSSLFKRKPLIKINQHG